MYNLRSNQCFCLWLSNAPRTVHSRNFPCFISCSQVLCHMLTVHKSGLSVLFYWSVFVLIIVAVHFDVTSGNVIPLTFFVSELLWLLVGLYCCTHILLESVLSPWRMSLEFGNLSDALSRMSILTVLILPDLWAWKYFTSCIFLLFLSIVTYNFDVEVFTSPAVWV